MKDGPSVAILGIDAAWTPHEPSGVALVAGGPGAWRCVAVAPSYAQFLELAQTGAAVSTFTRTAGSSPNAADLLAASTRLLGGARVDLIAIDMPLATTPIDGRREADRAVSREYGSRGCGTHSPSAVRPGPISANFVAAFGALGYPLATTRHAPATLPALLEVYPHPALLTLLNEGYRIPYKVSRARGYWPGITKEERRTRLLETWARIANALAAHLGPLPWPEAASVPATFAKQYEDALDALVCAWVGTRYVEGAARPLGDPAAAIWCP